MVRRMTSGSERFFVIFSKPLIGIRKMIRRWKDIVEAHLFISIIFCNSLRFKSSFEFTKSRNSVFFEFLPIFDTVFALVFEPFVETRRVIRRWKAMNKAQLSYVEMVLRFLIVLS